MDLGGRAPLFDEVMDEVMCEIRSTSDRKFPTDLLRGTCIVMEEAGELMKATLDWTRDSSASVGGLDQVYDEAKQVAATAIRLMERIRCGQCR